LRQCFVRLAEFFFQNGHASKLETAFRNGIMSGVETVKSMLGRQRISAAEEAKLFADWDDQYRNIRREKLQRGIVQLAPEDARDLHRGNDISQLEQDHTSARRIEATVAAE